MKRKIQAHKNGIQPIVTTITQLFRRLSTQIFNACLLYWFIQFSGSLKAQQHTEVIELESVGIAQQPMFSGDGAALQNGTGALPVYFNYRRRLLMYKGQRLDGDSFLKMCRSIRDSAVQEQLARYDEFTAQKQKLGFGMMGAGFLSMASFGGALGTGGVQQETSTMLAFTGLACVLAVPAMAIYNTVPHQRRKAVLFRDLPIAYNAYVEALQAAHTCP